VSRRVSHVCPYVELAQPSWEDYVATLGASHRANLRRRLRKLEERFTVELQRVEHEAELSGALDTLFELHHRRWAARGGSDGLGSTELMAFHRDFALAALRRGWLRLFVLRLDGRAVAALYGFRYHGRFLFYQSGFDPECAEHAVGMVLMAHAIRSAMEEGAREFDFLHGEEPYKYLWTTTSRQLARVELFPPGWRGRVEQRWRESRLAIKARVRGWLEERTSHPAEEPT